MKISETIVINRREKDCRIARKVYIIVRGWVIFHSSSAEYSKPEKNQQNAFLTEFGTSHFTLRTYAACLLSASYFILDDRNRNLVFLLDIAYQCLNPQFSLWDMYGYSCI